MSISDIVREHKLKLVVVQPHFMVNFGTFGEVRHLKASYLNHLFDRFVSTDIVTSILVKSVVVFTNIIVTIYDLQSQLNYIISKV